MFSLSKWSPSNLKYSSFFAYEPFVMFCVISNSVLIFMSGFDFISPEVKKMMDFLSWFFSILFLLEIIEKCKQKGVRGFLSNGEGKFDFFIFIASIYSILHPLIPSAGVSQLYLLRVARVFKVIRVIKFIPNRDHVYNGVIRATKASGAVFLYLFLMIYIFAIIGHFAFSSVLPENFGDPLKSMYTTFSIFMIEDWNQIPDMAAQKGIEGAFWIRSFFVFVLVTGGFLGIALANAVFVDEMVVDNNDGIEDSLEQIKTLLKEQAIEIEALKKEVENGR